VTKKLEKYLIKVQNHPAGYRSIPTGISTPNSIMIIPMKIQCHIGQLLVAKQFGKNTTEQQAE